MMKNTQLNFAPNAPYALQYFEKQPGYRVSPLRKFKLPAGQPMLIKDETARMGLGSFKALGGPYAVARLLMSLWEDKTGKTATLSLLEQDEFRDFAAQYTFVTASAGNHGIGVAAGSKALGAKARIYLARTVPETFDQKLRTHGAEVVRAGATYDDSVSEAIADTERTEAILLADGTWQGYTEIPKWVMEGYTVIAEELRHAFEASGEWPSHVFLQAGVGGLAAAMVHMIRQNWAEQPELLVVEPEAALCLQASHIAGKPVRADGPDSNMGRLDCKEPSIVAWQTLERCGVSYKTLSEQQGAAAAKAISDLGIATTPSGAAGYGALLQFVNEHEIPEGFRPLIIISEGL